MLPKIDLPIYDIELPVIKKKIKVRPFQVKEYKILLYALESGNRDQVVNATLQIVNNCLVDSNIDVNTMANYQLEFILLNLRAASISEKITLHFHGDTNSECEACQRKKTYHLDINQVKVHVPENYSNRVDLECGYSVIMSEPTYQMMSMLEGRVEEGEVKVDEVFEFTAKCIKQIIKGDEIYQEPDITLKDKIEFVENLPINDFYKLETFYEKLPILKHEISIKCPKCEKEYYHVLEGINDFLA